MLYFNRKEVNMNISENMMFFTTSYSGILEDIDNLKLAEEVRSVRKLEEGRTLSNVGGWQSNDLSEKTVENLPETQKLLDHMLNVGAEVYKQWNLDNEEILLDNFWFNINGKKDFNNRHSHPGSILSACYYVDTNKESGDIIFYRPDLQTHYFNPSNPNKYTNKKYEFSPVPGMFVIFPAYLEHLVLPNLSDEERISIAFNFI
jgi:uncharacterized protein (TIGR02466 family)